jgi:hypothetical protein
MEYDQKQVHITCVSGLENSEALFNQSFFLLSQNIRWWQSIFDLTEECNALV